MRRYLLSAMLFLSVLLSTLVAAHAASYTFTTFDLPSPGSQVNGINTAGQIVGYFGPGDATGRDYGYVTDGTTFTTIEFPGANHTHVYGINDRGQIVGSFYDGAMWHGFLKDGTTFTRFDVPAGVFGTEALGINTAGQIVGTFYDGSTWDGFLKDGATFTTFDFPGATFTWPSGINEMGRIVGSFDDGTGSSFDAFLKEGATVTTFDFPGVSNTMALGINTAGQIVGVFSDATGYHGFLKDGTAYTIINVPGARSTWARGINETGQIVGLFEDATGWHGFVATPIQGLAALGPAALWIGLKNSDDQGTAFDLQAEVALTSAGRSAPVATARTLCIVGVTRNPDKATEAMIQFGSFPPVSVAPSDVLSLTIRARIGTNPDGTKCPGHSNAVGLRLYYDSTSRPSRISAQLTPDPVRNFFLHSSSSDVLGDSAPTATIAKFKDSAGVSFAGGNPWRAIGTWNMTLP